MEETPLFSPYIPSQTFGPLSFESDGVMARNERWLKRLVWAIQERRNIGVNPTAAMVWSTFDNVTVEFGVGAVAMFTKMNGRPATRKKEQGIAWLLLPPFIYKLMCCTGGVYTGYGSDRCYLDG